MSDGGGRPDGERTRAARMLVSALRRVLAAAERGERVKGVIEGPKPEIPPAETGNFADGVIAERELRRAFGIDADSCELGPYIEEEDRVSRPSDHGRLGGAPRPIAFDGSFWLWFSRLTPERREVLLWLAKSFRDADRQTALIELVDERIERRVLRAFFRTLKHYAIAAFVGAAIAAHWLSDQIAWLVERMPALKAFWNLITGART